MENRNEKKTPNVLVTMSGSVRNPLPVPVNWKQSQTAMTGKSSNSISAILNYARNVNVWNFYCCPTKLVHSCFDRVHILSGLESLVIKNFQSVAHVNPQTLETKPQHSSSNYFNT